MHDKTYRKGNNMIAVIFEVKPTQAGKSELFSSYRIRVCSVVRDYTESTRDEAPTDSIVQLAVTLDPVEMP